VNVVRLFAKRLHSLLGLKDDLFDILFNPYYFARQGLLENLAQFSPRLEGLLLDVGCGSRPHEKLCVSVSQYIGMEIKDSHSKADVCYDGRRFPFRHEVFDAVLSTEVIEHVFDPQNFLHEINRVLKVRGLLLLTCPFVWDEHEQPHDYARYSSFGLVHLLEKSGFEILVFKKSLGDARAVFQYINIYIYKVAVSRLKQLNYVAALTLFAPFNLLGSALFRILPRNPDLYLDNIVLARKL
jgi:SAM-dependent methyltransferase